MNRRNAKRVIILLVTVLLLGAGVAGTIAVLRDRRTTAN